MTDHQPTETCDARAAAEFLRALAHPMRLRILCRLLAGELPVHGFETELGLRQPSLSQQLGQLREAGLVVTRREARSIFYRLADDRVRTVLAALHSTFGMSGKRQAQSAQAVAEAAPPSVRAETTDFRASAGCAVFAVVGAPALTPDREPIHA